MHRKGVEIHCCEKDVMADLDLGSDQLSTKKQSQDSNFITV